MDALTAFSFNDTNTGFSHKTDRQLKKSKLLFALMNKSLLVKIGVRITPLMIRWKIPVKRLIKNTIFEQFVGGETLAESSQVINQLQEFGIQAIMDYGAEGKGDELSFEQACKEFVDLINYASCSPGIQFISIKITGLARFDLLAKINSTVKKDDAGLSYTLDCLNQTENAEWQRTFERISMLCKNAFDCNIGILVDAEESWIQDIIDALTEQMMKKYNTNQAIVFNTVQLYRQNRLSFLRDSFNHAQGAKYILGVKLVRGAYMEKERKRALQLNYPSPIQKDKRSTDDDFNDAVRFCLANNHGLSVIIATHNEFSNALAIKMLLRHGLSANNSRIHFSQLYGMSDNITYNLAKQGYNVSKYLPYGPLEDVIPYLMRRAQENTSVAGQTGRELDLIGAEIKRRQSTAD